MSAEGNNNFFSALEPRTCVLFLSAFLSRKKRFSQNPVLVRNQSISMRNTRQPPNCGSYLYAEKPAVSSALTGLTASGASGTHLPFPEQMEALKWTLHTTLTTQSSGCPIFLKWRELKEISFMPFLILSLDMEREKERERERTAQRNEIVRNWSHFNRALPLR